MELKPAGETQALRKGELIGTKLRSTSFGTLDPAITDLSEAC